MNGVSPKLLTIREVAGMLGVNVRTVYRLLAALEFPKPIKVGRLTRFIEGDVIAWIERRRLAGVG